MALEAKGKLPLAIIVVMSGFVVYDFIFGLPGYYLGIYYAIWVMLSVMLFVTYRQDSSVLVKGVVVLLALFASFTTFGTAAETIPTIEVIEPGKMFALANVIITSILVVFITSLTVSPLVAAVFAGQCVWVAIACAVLNYSVIVSRGFSEKWITNTIIVFEQVLLVVIIWATSILLNRAITNHSRRTP